MEPSPAAPARMAVLAKLAAAHAVSGRRFSDPLDHLAWVESGEPFEAAGVEGFLEDLDVPSGPGRGLAASGVAALIARVEAGTRGRLGDLYMASFPREARHGAGEYFTPAWLVEHVLDRAGFDAAGSLLDPMCGAGAFLVAAVARLKSRHPGMPASAIVSRVHGIDVNPLAVLMARAEYLMALGPPPRGARFRIPVRCADSLFIAPSRRFGVVAGNPPWVGWQSLPEAYRERTKPLWKRHGLFADGGRDEAGKQGGMQTLLGRSRKDLAMLATYACAETFLETGGRLAFVITRSVFKSVGSGAGFRRFVLGDGTPLRVLAVDDFGGRRVFAGDGARVAVLTLEKGRPTAYPVPYMVWKDRDKPPIEHRAEPVDPRDATSAWLSGTEGSIRRLRRIIGPSAYRARAGAYTGGANGVYWVAVRQRREDGTCVVSNLPGAGKRLVAPVEARVEEELIFPLLKARDIGRFRAEPSGWILLPQDPSLRRGIDPARMKERFPLALAYLQRFEQPLAARRDRGTRSLVAAGAAFYSLFSVSLETLAQWKVVWRRIASTIEAAVVGPRAGARHPKPVVPQETCTFIACQGPDEAAYLAGVLNSSRFNDAAAAFAPIGGKSFGAPHLLRHIGVPRYDEARPAHRRLAGRVRHEGARLARADLDALVARAWC